MNPRITLGRRLRAIRDERGLSQRELAANSGLSTNAISLIERDENSPSVATLQMLASALNVKMSYFFDDEKTQKVLNVKAGLRPSMDSRGVRIEGIGGEMARQGREPFL